MAFIIGFPILVILTIVLLFVLQTGKQRLIGVGVLWGIPFFLGCLGIILDHYRRPIKLHPKDLYGNYIIDTTFYPGANARWQYNHYWFRITDDTLKLYFTNGFGDMDQYDYPIQFSDGPPAKWRLKSDSTQTVHHLLQSSPTLYRSHKRFYYVLKSPLYGNMFFRKVD